MRLKKSKLREALLLALIGAGTIAVAAQAQETPDQDRTTTRTDDASSAEAQTLEGITVTGTRIKSRP